MWVDDFHFYLSDKDGDWEEVPLDNSSLDEVKADKIHVRWWHWPHKKTKYEYAVVQDGDNNVLQIKNAEGYIPGMLFPRHPKVGEDVQKKLGGSLSCQVPLALWSDKDGTLGKNAEYEFVSLSSQLKDVNLALG